MRLTQHTDFALRLLIALAVVAGREGEAGATVTIRDVAERYGISRNHLMKVANELTRLGVVEGLRGRGGGVRLAVRRRISPSGRSCVRWRRATIWSSVSTSPRIPVSSRRHVA